jgi:hypothetical protein
VVKSEANVDHPIVNPAIVDPKLKICTIEVGSVWAWALTNSPPLTHAETTKTMRAGIQAQFANLKKVRGMLSQSR